MINIPVPVAIVAIAPREGADTLAVTLTAAELALVAILVGVHEHAIAFVQITEPFALVELAELARVHTLSMTLRKFVLFYVSPAFVCFFIISFGNAPCRL